jgi:hypothetical protein
VNFVAYWNKSGKPGYPANDRRIGEVSSTGRGSGIMATDFTVVLFQRQHFGDHADAWAAWEPNVPFVGLKKDFSFDCRNVDPRETAVLMFQSIGVSNPTNVLQVNGVGVFGGLPRVRAGNNWSANILLLEPRHQLKSSDNVLHVEARRHEGNIDDFIIDNVVILYKTVERQTPQIRA